MSINKKFSFLVRLRYDEVVGRLGGNATIPRERVLRIFKFCTNAANFIGNEIFEDKCLIHEWIFFSEYLPNGVRRLY